MPAPIYLPQDQSKLINSLRPAADNISKFLWDSLGNQIAQRHAMQQIQQQQQFQMEQARRQYGQQKELTKMRSDLSLRNSLLTQGGGKPPSLIQQYEYAKAQGYPGSFLQFKLEAARAGATNINLGDEYSKTATRKTANLQTEARLGTKFRADAMSAVKSQYAGEWQDMEPWQQDELLFREMHKRVKEAFPNQPVTFDSDKNAWVNLKTGKLIRKYQGFKPLEFQKNIR